MWSQEGLCQVFGMCLQQARSPPRSIRGQRHQGYACISDKRIAPDLPSNGYISLTIHPPTIFSYSKTQMTTEDRCGIHLEGYISSRIWQAQVIGIWGHNTEILQHEEASDDPSRCIGQATMSHTHPGWWSSRLRIQTAHTHIAVLGKQWKGSTCLRLRSWTFPYLCVLVGTSQLGVLTDH